MTLSYIEPGTEYDGEFPAGGSWEVSSVDVLTGNGHRTTFTFSSTAFAAGA